MAGSLFVCFWTSLDQWQMAGQGSAPRLCVFVDGGHMPEGTVIAVPAPGRAFLRTSAPAEELSLSVQVSSLDFTSHWLSELTHTAPVHTTALRTTDRPLLKEAQLIYDADNVHESETYRN